MASSRSYRKAVNTDNEITKPLSLVQQRARQFEALATLQEKPKECNWWLSEFKSLKDISCECEPCESFNSIDQGAIDSQQFIDVEKKHVEDIAVDHIVEDAQDDEHDDELLSGEEISVDAKESISEDEKLSNNDNDDEFVLADSCAQGEVIEAVNDNVNFKGTSITHPVDDEIHATDE